MKALRRSIKGEKDTKPQHASITPKSAVAIVPPKKVIKALFSYEAQTEQELTFVAGDFFHVVGRENDTDWYEACNPSAPDPRARRIGLVPVSFFQELGRTEGETGQSMNEKSPRPTDYPDSGYSDTPGLAGMISPPMESNAQRASKQLKGSGGGAMVYGVVMYDFAAERPDELEAKAGEAIIVIAQSNPEWFVAKPIGRLGGPGLIPVAFIEIRDMTTGKKVDDPVEAVQRAGVPKVEEWKKMAADYKNSSISLGKFEGGAPIQSPDQGADKMSPQQGNKSSTNGQGYRQSQQAKQTPQSSAFSPTSTQPLYSPLVASIPRYCFAEDKYWFVLEAQLEDGRWWELSRYYEDFYDFQIALLKAFPTEAGNTGSQKRTLPYMPGPVSYVTDSITEGRQHNLDSYVKNLLQQPQHISKSTLVKQFFAPREGDYEIAPPKDAAAGDYRLSGGSANSSGGSPGAPTSRQSSRGNLDGAGYQAGLSAAPSHGSSHQRNQGSISQGHGPTRQGSTSQQSPNVAQNGPQSSAMKVKIYFGDDLIAIRVPADIKFQALHDKVRDRLKIPKGDDITLAYKDESTGERPALLSNHDLDTALNRNDKLVLYASYA